jgi:hypothetical protein
VGKIILLDIIQILFKSCAQILFQVIDEGTYNGVHLPVGWLAILEYWVTAASAMGVPISNQQETLDFFGQIEKRVVEGPGNPTVNN